MIFVNRTRPRLDGLRSLIEHRMSGSGIAFEFIQNDDPAVNDRLMAALPPGSLVINATGMGKDTPGSPITDAGVFPLDGFAWELNYRGELGFMRQALAQAERRRLHVEDGWYYFLVGWIDIMSRVFDVPITPDRFAALARAAEQVR
jgi:shikimate 5-dehydrogenase